MSHVFISYSHDNQDWCFALDGRLRAENFDTFVDESIRPSFELRNILQTALDRAFAIVIICTKSSMESPEVSFEWAYAMGKGIPIIPLIYEPNCNLHPRLQTIKNLDFSEPRQRHWHELINFLREIRDKPLIDQPEGKLLKKCKDNGLVDIDKYRSNHERSAYIQKALNMAAEGSELIVVGRSLIDWSLEYENIGSLIKNKSLHVKLAILDENSLPNKNVMPDDTNNKSWIEMPISSDWAIHDVPTSMKRFRRIHIEPNTGSLQIYGLPFYVSHSFVAYTNKNDNYRYCLEEVGMAFQKDKRPFIEFKSSLADMDSYTSSLERMYKSFMIEERLLLSDNGERKERDTTQRAKIIVPKIEKFG